MATSQPQPPTILQLGANDPLEMARASSLAAPFVNGVDLNCGCPQGWACAETLGAALMNRRELVRDMLVDTRRRLRDDGWAVGMDADMESSKGRSVSVKIRVHDDLRYVDFLNISHSSFVDRGNCVFSKTMDFIETVVGHPQERNVDWLTIHPRTRYMPSTTPIRTEALEILTEKYADRLPILLSGDVFDLATLPLRATRNPEDQFATLTIKEEVDYQPETPKPSNTHLSGFMSARGLLANPAMFAGHAACPWEALERFMCNMARCPLPLKLAVHHAQEMCSPGMGTDKSALLSKKERARFAELMDVTELVDFLDEKIAEHKGQQEGMRRDL